MKGILDSFLERYQRIPDLAERVTILSEFSESYFDSHKKVLLPMLKQELERCIKEAYVDGEILLSIHLFYLHFDRTNIDEAARMFNRISEMIAKSKTPHVRAYAYDFFAYSHAYQGRYDKAFRYAYEALKEYEGIDLPRKGWSIYALAVLFSDTKDFANAEKKFGEAHLFFSRHQYAYGCARSETGLAAVYIQLDRFEEAEELIRRSLQVYEKMETPAAISRAYNDLGLLLKRKGFLKEALADFAKALDIRRSISHQQGIATTLNELGETYFLLKDYPAALLHLDEAAILCKQIGNIGKLASTHYLLYQTHKALSDYSLALSHFEAYTRFNNEVSGQASANKIKAIQTAAATEKAEKEAEIERIRNVELRSAYEIIENKNKEILDSIYYARRIQGSLLPSEKYIGRQLRRLAEKEKTL